MTQALFAAWVRYAPIFTTDSAMQGLSCGGALYFAKSAGLYSLLPPLIAMTSPHTLALRVAAAALAGHTISFIAAHQTNRRTHIYDRGLDGFQINHELGLVQFSKAIAERALQIGELALISLLLGGGLSIRSIVSIYFAKVLANQLSHFFFFNTFRGQANKFVHESQLKAYADSLASKIEAHRFWGSGHRLGGN